MSITTRIESISNHLETAYDKLEDLGADLTETNKNIENLSTILENIYNDYPKNTAEGTSFTLTSTKKGKIGFNLKGDIEQFTTTGKQLMDNQRPTETVNGVTFTRNNDGSITLNGTASENFDYIFTNPTGASTNNQNLDVGTYILTGVTDGSSSTYYLQAVMFDGTSSDYNSQFTTPKTITVSTACTFRCFIVVKSGTVFSNLTIYPMIRLSSISDDSYEPYTGGIASPNSNYPQEVQTVTGDNNIKIEGKNLFNVNDFLNTTGAIRGGIQTRIDNEGNFIMTGTGTDGYGGMLSLSLPKMPWLHGKQLKVSTTSDNTHIGIYLKNPGGYNSSIIYNSNENLKLDLQTTSALNYTIDETFKVQIEIGDTATTYEPYKFQLYPINLGVENLLEIKNTARTINGVTFTPQEDGSILINGTATANATYPLNRDSASTGKTIPLKSNTTYTISKSSSQDVGNILFQVWYDKNGSSAYSTNTFTTVEENYLGAYIRVSNGDTINNVKIYCQIEEGDTVHSYTQYGKQIELCKWDNDTQDYIYKENNKWYQYNRIGKFVINGSENDWGSTALTTGRSYYIIKNDIGLKDKNSDGTDITSNYLQGINYGTYYNIGGIDGISYQYYKENHYMRLFFKNAFDYVADMKTWLSYHNVRAYYLLANATSTEITSPTLINQLNQLEKAKSYNSQTNISQTNQKLPFIIDISTLKNS